MTLAEVFCSSTASGNMIAITDTTDFEFFSSTSKGAIQGYGYVFHAGRSLHHPPSQLLLTDSQRENTGSSWGVPVAIPAFLIMNCSPRILRLSSVTDFSVHDVALVDGQ